MNNIDIKKYDQPILTLEQYCYGYDKIKQQQINEGFGSFFGNMWKNLKGSMLSWVEGVSNRVQEVVGPDSIYLYLDKDTMKLTKNALNLIENQPYISDVLVKMSGDIQNKSEVKIDPARNYLIAMFNSTKMQYDNQELKNIIISISKTKDPNTDKPTKISKEDSDKLNNTITNINKTQDSITQKWKTFIDSQIQKTASKLKSNTNKALFDVLVNERKLACDLLIDLVVYEFLNKYLGNVPTTQNLKNKYTQAATNYKTANNELNNTINKMRDKNKEEDTSEIYYLDDDNQKQGPINYKKLTELIANGTIVRTSKVFVTDETKDWVVIDTIPRFKQILDNPKEAPEKVINDIYYVDIATNAKIGPKNSTDIIGLIKKNKITDVTKIWYNGITPDNKTWVDAKDVEIFKTAFAVKSPAAPAAPTAAKTVPPTTAAAGAGSKTKAPTKP